ncbi:MAG: RNA polymerase sigma factor, partial [Chryseobacterium sp.]
MDQIEFTANISRHFQALLSHALKFTNNEDDAKDLVQETLIKGMRFCQNFDTGTNLRGWLYVIMKNTFI